jgi:hypothetical protein
MVLSKQTLVDCVPSQCWLWGKLVSQNYTYYHGIGTAWGPNKKRSVELSIANFVLNLVGIGRTSERISAVLLFRQRGGWRLTVLLVCAVIRNGFISIAYMGASMDL